MEEVSMQLGLNSLVPLSHLLLHCLFKPTSHAKLISHLFPDSPANGLDIHKLLLSGIPNVSHAANEICTNDTHTNNTDEPKRPIWYRCLEKNLKRLSLNFHRFTVTLLLISPFFSLRSINEHQSCDWLLFLFNPCLCLEPTRKRMYHLS